MGKDWDSDKGGRDAWIAWMTEVMTEAMRVLKPGAHGLVWALPRTSGWTQRALEDAGFEVRDVVTHLFGCYSEDTECFTRNGWVKYHQLNQETEVLQWDNKTSQFSWTKPLAIIVKPYSGKMHNLKNRHTDQLLTPDHRTYCKIKNVKNLHSDLFTVLPPVEFKKSYQVELPLAGKLYGDVEVAPEYAYMVGWWLTDAWIHGDKKACMFSQSKPATLKKLKHALSTSNCKFSEYTKVPKKETHATEHTFYVTGDLAIKLIQEFPDRKLSWEMLNWSDSAKAALIEGLVDGDGSVREDQHGYVFWSKDPNRLEIFQMLALSSGHRTLVDFEKGCVHVNPKFASTELQSKHYLEPQYYSGDIWCLTVPHEAFLVRRNGKPFISGNTGFPKSLDISKALDKAAGAKRQVIAEVPHTSGIQRNHSIQRAEWDGNNESKQGRLKDELMKITAPATDAAKQWQGWGTALKPASEHWILVRKPCSEKTVAANVLKHGTGGINIDASRIAGAKPACKNIAFEAWRDSEGREDRQSPVQTYDPSQGRFPANLILDEEAAASLDEQSLAGGMHSAGKKRTIDEGTHAGADPNIFGKGLGGPSARFGDSGGASRFFYVAKASSSDKNQGVEDLLTWENQDQNLQDLMVQLNELLKVTFADMTQPQDDSEWNTLWFGKPQMDGSLKDAKSIIETTLKTITDLKTWNASAPLSISESIQAAIRTIEMSGLSLAEAAENIKKYLQITTNEKTDFATNASHALLLALNNVMKLAKRGNVHATVKSTALMTYLIKLITPPNGVVLDPFMGSGSTGVAAVREEFKFVGIEKEETYFQIAKRRIQEENEKSKKHPT